MGHPVNHLGMVKHHLSISKRKQKRAIDVMAYIIGIGGNIAVVPQIVKAWSSDAPGLAISTWMLFSFFWVIWLIYAVLHKQKPLIVAQIVSLVCNISVVLGWVYNSST